MWMPRCSLGRVDAGWIIPRGWQSNCTVVQYMASQHTLRVVEWFGWPHFGDLQQRNDVAAVGYVWIGIANAGRHASLSRDQGKIHPIRANREGWSYHSLVIACRSYNISIFNHVFCICSHLSTPVCNTGNKIKASFMDLAMKEKISKPKSDMVPTETEENNCTLIKRSWDAPLKASGVKGGAKVLTY